MISAILAARIQPGMRRVDVAGPDVCGAGESQSLEIFAFGGVEKLTRGGAVVLPKGQKICTRVLSRGNKVCAVFVFVFVCACVCVYVVCVYACVYVVCVYMYACICVCVYRSECAWITETSNIQELNKKKIQEPACAHKQ